MLPKPIISTQPPPQPSSIVILGAGRLGSALAISLLQQQLPLHAVWNRRPPTQDHPSLPYTIGPLPRQTCQQADLLLLTVSDHALADLTARLHQEDLASSGQIILHCSGLLGSEVLAPLQQKGCEIGSMHPLQPVASAHSTQPLFTGVAVGIEGSPLAQHTASWLAQQLGGQTFSLEGVNKALYHTAAVFASNYVVGLAHVAVQLLQKAGLTHDTPLSLLLPLLQQAVANLQSVGLPRALTGPLSRGDTSTIAQHIHALDTESPEYTELYLALAQATLPLAQQQRQSKHLDTSALEPLAALLQHRIDQKDNKTDPK